MAKHAISIWIIWIKKKSINYHKKVKNSVDKHRFASKTKAHSDKSAYTNGYIEAMFS